MHELPSRRESITQKLGLASLAVVAFFKALYWVVA